MTFPYKFLLNIRVSDLRLLLILWYPVMGWATDGKTFLHCTHLNAHQKNQSSSGVCGQLPLSSLSGLPWWVLPLQGGERKALRQYIKEEQVRVRTLKLSDTPKTDPEIWSVARTINTTGRGYSFPVKQNVQAAHQTAWNGIKNTNISTMGGYSQIWDGFMWLTWGMDV